MIIFITILIILACIILGFFVLIQNPKGGGLTGSFGSIGSQVMGVKQTTDVMEKGTWTAVGVIGALCIISIMFFPKMAPNPTNQQSGRKGAPAQQQQSSGPTKGAPAKK